MSRTQHEELRKKHDVRGVTELHVAARALFPRKHADLKPELVLADVLERDDRALAGGREHHLHRIDREVGGLQSSRVESHHRQRDRNDKTLAHR